MAFKKKKLTSKAPTKNQRKGKNDWFLFLLSGTIYGCRNYYIQNRSIKSFFEGKENKLTMVNETMKYLIKFDFPPKDGKKEQ